MKRRLLVPLKVILFVSAISVSHAGWDLLPDSPVAPYRHDDIFFLNPRLGWITNGDGEVHRTTDGGEMWMQQTTIGAYGRCIGFADSLNGWVGTLGGLSGAFLVTSDGGFTWKGVTDFSGPPPESVCGISVVNDSVVYAAGAYHGVPRVLKTTDRGTNWVSFGLDSLAAGLVDCYFFTPDSGIVVGSTGVGASYGRALILFTSDGGNSWQTKFLGSRDGELCWKISFPSATVGYISIEDFTAPSPVYFLRTTDRGATWSEKVFLNSHFDEQGIGFATETLGWIGGWGGPTYTTTDGGDTWAQTGPGTFVNRFRFLGDSLGYCVGSRAFKYYPDSTSTGIEPAEEPIVLKYKLYQNFPNPFNPTTTIRFSLPDLAYVRLSIVDLLGREVAVIADDVRAAGDHIVVSDGRNSSGVDVSSGVYVYRMTTAEQTLSRKLMLLR